MKKAVKMEAGGATTRSKRHRDAYRKAEGMQKGGKVCLCRGMGAAIKGANFKVNK